MKLPNQHERVHSDYQIVISRSWQRPSAAIYLFGIREPLPTFPIPLRRAEEEPLLPLNQILHELYDLGGYDMALDYRQTPEPPLTEEDTQWAERLLQSSLG